MLPDKFLYTHLIVACCRNRITSNQIADNRSGTSHSSRNSPEIERGFGTNTLRSKYASIRPPQHSLKKHSPVHLGANLEPRISGSNCERLY
jgi:hypothetical protein